MAVIINEFEIITEPPADAQEQVARPAAAPQASPLLQPQEIERIMRHQRKRMARVWAD